MEGQIATGICLTLASKTLGTDKTQPYSEARTAIRAATGTPIPQAELDPEAES